MSEEINNEERSDAPERKKISLQEAIKQKMAEKQQQRAEGSKTGGYMNATKKMKSQQTKKPNNQRKRTGV